MISTLAKEFGWSEEEILALPLGRAFSYQHSIFIMNGMSTRWLTLEEEKDDALSLIINLKGNKINQPDEYE